MSIDPWHDELLKLIRLEDGRLTLGEDLWELVETSSGSWARTNDPQQVLANLDAQIELHAAHADPTSPAGQIAAVVQAELTVLRSAIEVRVHGPAYRAFQAAMDAAAPEARVAAPSAPRRSRMH